MHNLRSDAIEEVPRLLSEIRSPERLPTTNRAAVTATFTRESLGKVCALVRAAAVRAGIAPRDIEDLLIALSEVVTNAIRYAGGVGSITVRRLGGGLIAEIRDSGPGLPDSLTAGRPFPDIPVGADCGGHGCCVSNSMSSAVRWESQSGVHTAQNRKNDRVRGVRAMTAVNARRRESAAIERLKVGQRFAAGDVDAAVERAVKQLVGAPIRESVGTLVEWLAFASLEGATGRSATD